MDLHLIWIAEVRDKKILIRLYSVDVDRFYKCMLNERLRGSEIKNYPSNETFFCRETSSGK